MIYESEAHTHTHTHAAHIYLRQRHSSVYVINSLAAVYSATFQNCFAFQFSLGNLRRTDFCVPAMKNELNFVALFAN